MSSSILAFRGGEPLRKKPFAPWPTHGEEEKRLLLEALESGSWSSDGPKEAEFCRKFADFCGAKEAFCVSNATVGLEIALRALGIGPGDEVIVPAITWIATATSVVSAGAVPVFADVREEDWCIDPRSIRDKITPRTRAVIPVHLYSQVAEMDAILEIARDHSLSVVEDCAHAHGARWKDRGVGTMGSVGVFSFQESKPMTSGEGGVLLTDDEELAVRIYGLKNCGRPWRKDSPRTYGGNHRITEFQAAVLLAQLDKLALQIEKKYEMVDILRQQLSALPGIHILPSKEPVTRRGLYCLALAYDAKAFGNIHRDSLLAALQAEGIPVAAPYAPVYQASLYTPGAAARRWGKGDHPERMLSLGVRCPVSERISYEEGLTLPHHVFLGGEDDMKDIARGFEKVRENASELLFKDVKSKARSLLRKVGFRA